MKAFFRYMCLFIILILVGVVGIHLYGIDTNSSYSISEKELSKLKKELLEKSQVTVVYQNQKQSEKTSINDDINSSQNSIDTTKNEVNTDKKESVDSSVSKVEINTEELIIEVDQNYS